MTTITDVKKELPCSRCKGKEKETVSRELSHYEETCPQCRGSGKEPERFARQFWLAEAIDQMNFMEAGCAWEDNRLRVFVDLQRLPDFLNNVDELTGDYRPRLDRIVEIDKVGYRVELVFSPFD